MDDQQNLMLENKRLKEEVEIYLKGYENLLTEKLILEQEYENYKLAIEESKKIKNPGLYGSTTVFNMASDNAKFKSEIDEYLNSIWELQTYLSLKEEEIRVLTEKNKQLENELNNLKEELKDKENQNENKNENDYNENENINIKESIKKSINESIRESRNDINQSIKDSINNNINESKNIKQSGIFNMKDLYSSMVLQQTETKIKNRIKTTVNLNIISEEDMEKIEKQKEEEEKERLRKEEEEFERKRKEEEERQRKLLEEEKIKRELENKIKEYHHTKKELQKKFDNLKEKTNEFYKDIQNQNIYINNYNNFVNELNEEINKLRDKLNISLYGEKAKEETEKINIRIQEFTNSLETISGKNKQLSEFIDNSKNIKLKNVEQIQTEIQEKFNEINNEKKNKNLITLKNIYELNNEFISNKLNELEKVLESLNTNKKAYEKAKISIEEEKEKLKKEITDYIQKVEKAFKILNQIQKGPQIDPIFLRGSMLLGINFDQENDIFSSTKIFTKEDYNNYINQDLKRTNWNEICYVYEGYDIHDVHYELKAVGLPPNMFFTSCSFGFYYDTDIEILEFQKDGKKEQYTYKNYSLSFKIHLKNMESNKIHLKYKESPSKAKLTEGERKERKIVKNHYYGLSKNNAGENAKFTLKIKCDFEVISFEDEFFIKTNEKEYTWGGKVPPEGKRTYVKMSKSKGKFNFLCSDVIESRNNNNIKNTKMTVPVSFVGGNNELIKIESKSDQTTNVKLKQEERVYEIHFSNTQSKKGEFKIQGELINRCKGEWECDLTDEQIEAQIPNDYKYNKEKFKEIALQIIDNYDKQHKDDLIKVLDVVKIGKWLKKNITYDLSYSGRNEITATETMNNRIGVCHHFTKLYNALMYSLGYQVIYVSGYALDKKDIFGKEDAHAWSLFKIDGKWLPFDATWGIFSGKLPVCHVFKQFFPLGTKVIGTDQIRFGKGKDEGKYLEK